MHPSTCFFTFLSLLVAVSAGSRTATAPRRRNTPGDLLRRGLYQLSENSTDAGPTGTGIVSVALSIDKQSYYAVATIGNLSFRLALDTGSADTFLISDDCKTDTCKRIPRYPLSSYSSPSFQAVNNNETTFSVSYADTTSVSGFVAKESISFSNVTSPSQALGLVTKSNITFVEDISGVLGLSFPRLSMINAVESTGTPFFATLAQQGLLSYPLFGLSLTRGSNGSLTLGALDSTVVRNVENITWNDVIEFSPIGTERNSSGYLHWALPLADISVNGTAITPKPTYANATHNQSIALLDVGTPGIFGPYQDVSRIFAAIPEARLVDADVGQWVMPCDTSITLSFTFGDTAFVLQPTDYLIGPASGNPSLCLAWPRASAPSPDGIDWQFGSAFLRTVYSIFSYGISTKEPPMIGLYPLNNVSAPAQPYDAVSSFLASATVATTLPNSLLATPSPTTPPYGFNTSVPASAGAIVSSDLATSTYSPVLINTRQLHASGLPRAAPTPTMVTFVITDGTIVRTSTSAVPTSSVQLGYPSSNAASLSMSWPRSIAWTIVAFFSLYCFL